MRRMVRLLVKITILGLAVGLVVRERFEDLYFESQIASLKNVLAREMGKEQSMKIVSAVRRHYKDISAGRPQTEKGVMRFHLANAMLVLATYRALGETLDEEEKDLVRRTERLMWVSGVRDVEKLMFSPLRMTAEPFDLFRRIVGFFNRHVFPAQYGERTEVDVPGGFGFDYASCFYHDFCLEEGVPELAAAFCYMDLRMKEVIPPQIEMKRARTLGLGSEKCEYRFYPG